MSPRLLGAALLAALGLATAPARADLVGDAERLASAWADRGARVERLPPVFLEHGHAKALTLPPREGEPACITIAVLGVRTADFFLVRGDRSGGGGDNEATSPRAQPRRGEPDVDPSLRSAGGAVTISTCGAERARLDRLRVEMSAPRAALEMIIVRSDTPVRPLREILPERAAGLLAPHGDTGGPLAPAPLAERLARAERRARSDGAAQVERVTGRAPVSGVGRFDRELAPGCHRLEIMADAGDARAHPPRPTDIDADVRDASGRVLARDRADLPDARLDLCVGEITPVSIPFVGAAGAVPVILTHARWVMPARIPQRWGARPRAGILGALLRRHAPEPAEAPIREVLGLQGTTSIPFEVEPGRCYLAALAMVRGEARALRLAATLGGRTVRDDVSDHPEGASVTFCAEHERVARLDADVRAASAFWTLALWPMGAASP